MMNNLFLTSIKKYLVVDLIFFSSLVIAQNTSKINPCKEVENTYQVISHQPRTKLAITTDVCEIVKRERKKNETVIFKVNELYSIKIYSEMEIPTLKLPLEYIIYKEN